MTVDQWGWFASYVLVGIFVAGFHVRVGQLDCDELSDNIAALCIVAAWPFVLAAEAAVALLAGVVLLVKWTGGKR